VPDIRNCEQCGVTFVLRREHDRFCSPACRVTWNRGHSADTDPAAEVRALEWSVSAMRDVTERLSGSRTQDQARALTMVGEAVWWVTIVDARLVRHYLDVYDGVMARQAPAERRLTEGTLAGLRFVRNQMGVEAGYVDFVEAGAGGADGPDYGDRQVTAWRWRPMPEPALGSPAERGQAWEMARYRAYDAHLAGQMVGEVFGRAAAFLDRAASEAASVTDISALAGGA
jgi:hypothetical protein